MHRESEEKKINVWAKTQTDGEEHSISSYINKAYFKNMKLREKRKWSARKKMINIKVQYTLIVKHIFMTTLGNVMGHSIENMHAVVRFSSD